MTPGGGGFSTPKVGSYKGGGGILDCQRSGLLHSSPSKMSAPGKLLLLGGGLSWQGILPGRSCLPRSCQGVLSAEVVLCFSLQMSDRSCQMNPCRGEGVGFLLSISSKCSSAFNRFSLEGGCVVFYMLGWRRLLSKGFFCSHLPKIRNSMHKFFQ